MNIRDAALSWHDAGACVLPAAADGSKRPALAWDRYKNQRPDRSDVDAWSTAASGIGIICGQASGNVEMFEAEAAAVEDGLVKQLTAMLPVDLQEKLNTYVERSPKGGVHWIFRVDGVPVKGNTKLARRAERKPGQQTVTVLFETRGEGGWTVIAPSSGPTHPTGRPWEVVYGKAGVIPLLTAEEYRLLHACAATFDQMPTPVAPFSQPDKTVGSAIDAPGQDFEHQVTWDEILLPAGWTKVRQRGDVIEWVRPGKNPRDGISATTGWQGDWLYVFTTSTEFESERTYTKFGAYALLHHGGNFSTAARDLRQRGYGAKTSPHTRPLQSVPAGPTVTDETTVPTSDQQPTPTWGRMDLAEFLDGSYEPQVPELLRRSDGKFLLYRGRVHSFHGESESGKSWAALYAAAEAMLAGEHVVMIDFESDAHTVVGRLLLLGVPRDIIAELFDYRRPEVDPANLGFEQAAWLELLSHRYGIAIIDGITEALAIYGVPSKDNDEVTAWIRQVPRQVAVSTGAAVVDVDHVTKDADTRGRFAIGGQAKMASLDGAAYVVEVIDPLGVGLVGRISLRVAKDRPGGVRPISGSYRKTDRTQETCVMVVDSSVTGKTSMRIEMPRSETQDTPADDRQPWRPTGYMERVSKVLENANCPMSRNAINLSLQARRDYVMQAVDFLIEDGYAAADGPMAYRSTAPTIRSVKPYREHDVVPGSQMVPKASPDLVPGSPPNVGEPGEPSQDTGDSVPGTGWEPGGNQVIPGFSDPEDLGDDYA